MGSVDQRIPMGISKLSRPLVEVIQFEEKECASYIASKNEKCS